MAKEKDTFFKELRALAIPMAIQNFMLALVSATDAIMLGKVDQDSMAAVSQAGQIQFFLNLVVMAFSIGVGIMTAQYWGKGDKKTIERIAPTGLKIILTLGGMVTLAAFFIPELLMRALTSDEKLIPLGTGYIKTVALSYVVCGITQVYFALLKNTGKAKYSSVISSFAVVLNIILNALLIFGLLGFPELGIEGAAIATVVSRIVELLLAVIVNMKKGSVQLYWRGMIKKLDKLLMKDYMKYTVPVIGASIVWGGAFMSYTIIMGHLGSDAVAANSITAIAKNLISCIIFGVGGGTGVLVGNLLGANELEKAKKYAGRLTRIAAVLGFTTGGVLVLSTPFIISLLNLSETAEGYLRIMIIFCGLNLCAQAMNHVILDGVFGAGGDTIFDMRTNIVTMWCVTLPLGLLAAFVFKIPAPFVYGIVNMDEIVKLPAVFIHYKKYIWLRNITRDV